MHLQPPAARLHCQWNGTDRSPSMRSALRGGGGSGGGAAGLLLPQHHHHPQQSPHHHHHHHSHQYSHQQHPQQRWRRVVLCALAAAAVLSTAAGLLAFSPGPLHAAAPFFSSPSSSSSSSSFGASSSSSSSSTSSSLLSGEINVSSSPFFLRGRRTETAAAEEYFNATLAQARAEHLVLVPGHAVLLRSSAKGADREDAAWYMLPYQRGQDLPAAFTDHMRRGAQIVNDDPTALLVFSGGQTRVVGGPLSEAQSYFLASRWMRWWGLSHVAQRTVTEDHARDSFENLLFSVCRFREITGRYPQRITVVGFAFKRKRFVDLHRQALRFPRSRFHYVGLVPTSDRFDHSAAHNGEHEHAVVEFTSDPYGCHSHTLQEKRGIRNPYRRTSPYSLACPEIRGLLEYCGTTYYSGTLPWPAFTSGDQS